MSRTPASVRPAATVNAEIRALWAQAGGQLSAVEAEQYQRLLLEWAAAVREERAEAARFSRCREIHRSRPLLGT
ncbi:hypothetical protein [Streptomyces scopuliridis]|uniref:hypothetical protein n=1 Tax=Streptomyces scopuliridis TaxID=452529 RepID=UPI00369D3089